jgi:hypothetical protein
MFQCNQARNHQQTEPNEENIGLHLALVPGLNRMPQTPPLSNQGAGADDEEDDVKGAHALKLEHHL